MCILFGRFARFHTIPFVYWGRTFVFPNVNNPKYIKPRVGSVESTLDISGLGSGKGGFQSIDFKALISSPCGEGSVASSSHSYGPGMQVCFFIELCRFQLYYCRYRLCLPISSA